MHAELACTCFITNRTNLISGVPTIKHGLSSLTHSVWQDLFLQWEWRLPRARQQALRSSIQLTRGLEVLTAHRRLLETRIRQMRRLLGRSPTHQVRIPLPFHWNVLFS